MSADEKGFLARWSARKREAARDDAVESDVTKSGSDTKQAPADTPTRAAGTIAGEPAEQPFDLASLPRLEELTADTDMTVFFRKGVPESIRNAALRKSWALDPAVRNYVSPALDYAYDWNTPGGVPGAGELAPGTDVVRMVEQVMGWTEPQRPADAEPGRQNETPADRTDDVRHADASPLSVRRSEMAPIEQRDRDATPTSASVEKEESQGQPLVAAPQQTPRRHGSARPK
jgi:hypothetical protein